MSQGRTHPGPAVATGVLTLALGLALAVAAGRIVRAEGELEGLLVRGETISQGALEPLVSFADGRTIDTTQLGLAADTLALADSQLLLYDRTTGLARIIDDLNSVPRLMSPTHLRTTLAELFSEIGTVVLFETPPPALVTDPTNARVFLAYSPSSPPALYFPESEGVVIPTCTCGDVTGDGVVDILDSDLVRGSLADPSGSPLSTQALLCCSVIGPSGNCDIVDVTVIQRSLIPAGPGLSPVCSATLPP